MPQVDLRPLFTPTSQQIPTNAVDSPDQTESGLKPKTPERSVRITGEQVVNVGFVTAACLGAIISAAFLFKGGEVFQEVAAWPRELFYGRPSRVPHATANNGRGATDGSTQSSPPPSDTGDPFSSTSKLLDLNPAPGAARPNSRSSGAPFSSSSTFDRLNMMSPPNDGLSHGLTQGITPAVAQTASPAGANPVAASQTAGASATQTGAVAKAGLTAATHKTSSGKTSATRRLSASSGKHRAIKKSTASARRARAHFSIRSNRYAKIENWIGSLIPRSTSSGVSQTANIRSVGGIGHGIGRMNATAATGLEGGFGGHSFGRAER